MIEYHPICVFEGNHRFALEQAGENVLIVIGVNPSTADENKPDPTMQSVLRFVNAFGYDGFVMLNLSSERTTSPDGLAVSLDASMHRKNLAVITKMGKKYPDAPVLLAYGNLIEKRMYLEACFVAICATFDSNRHWLCIGGTEGMTKYGHPRHPLYASVKMGLCEFDLPAYKAEHYYYSRPYDINLYQHPEDEVEWRWCLAGNIIKEHLYGVEKEVRYGTKHFVPGAKVYCSIAFNDPDRLVVIGTPRHSRKLIEVIIERRKVENLRIQKCFKPAVLQVMKQRHFAWWGNTDSDHEEILRCMRFLNEE